MHLHRYPSRLLRTLKCEYAHIFRVVLFILSLGINSPKVMGTKSSYVEHLKLLSFLLEFGRLTRRERKDSWC